MELFDLLIEWLVNWINDYMCVKVYIYYVEDFIDIYYIVFKKYE